MGKGRLGAPTVPIRRKGRPVLEPYVKASKVVITHADGTQETQGAYNPWELAKVRKGRTVAPKKRAPVTPAR